MSVEEEKTFVMKHAFDGVDSLELRKYHSGPEEKHFGIPWKLTLYKTEARYDIDLDCLFTNSGEEWSIDTTLNTKIRARSVRINTKCERVFEKGHSRWAVYMESSEIDAFAVYDSFDILECKVTIHKMTGIEDPIEKRIFRSFNDESAKKFSDVVLVVKDQKFYMNKMYLASHSSYFESLFLGNFDESKQSEVELKDIEPEDFQKFLEVLYGEPAIDDDNIDGILQLADMYDAKTVIRQCEFFYLRVSQQDLKSKFTAAVKYNMKELQQKCISELKNVEELDGIIPEDDTLFDKEMWKKFYKLSIDFHRNK